MDPFNDHPSSPSQTPMLDMKGAFAILAYVGGLSSLLYLSSQYVLVQVQTPHAPVSAGNHHYHCQPTNWKLEMQVMAPGLPMLVILQYMF